MQLILIVTVLASSKKIRGPTKIPELSPPYSKVFVTRKLFPSLVRSTVESQAPKAYFHWLSIFKSTVREVSPRTKFKLFLTYEDVQMKTFIFKVLPISIVFSHSVAMIE